MSPVYRDPLGSCRPNRPPFWWARSPSPKTPSPSRCGPPARGARAAPDAARPTRRPLANRAGAAGRCSRFRSPVPWEHLPGYAALEDEDDAGQGGGPIFDPWPTACGLWRFGRQQRFYDLPQLVGGKFFAHADERTIHSRAGLARYSYCRGSTSRSGVGRLPRRSTCPKAPSSRGSCGGRRGAPLAPRSGARRPTPGTTACRAALARRPGTPPTWRPSGVSAAAA